MAGNVENNKFRILSLDGGGIRGVFSAHILDCMAARLSINVHTQFDMIAGTSTGSIIASAVACNINPSAIVQFYKEHGSTIFSPKKSFWPKALRPAVRSLYEGGVLRELLKDVFADIKLGDIKIPLLLPATDIGNGGVHVFKSSYSADFNRDENVLLRDAILASCSAPIYFDPALVSKYALADGGLWANNPGLAALIDAQYRLNKNPADINMLSIGTGHSTTFYGVNADRNWGLINGWRGQYFISFLLSLQAQATQNYLELLLGQERLLRLNFESDTPLPLDDCSSIDTLVSRADKLFTAESKKINLFLSESRGSI